MLKKLIAATLLTTTILSNTVQAKEIYTYKTIEVDAEITCYFLENSTMEGGFKSSTGEWLDDSEYTCAGPKCLPYGTEVTLGDVNNWRTGHTYTVNDRGGAIIVDEDGVYHFDLLVSCEEVANNFGRQRCKVNIRIPLDAGETY